MSMLQNWSKVVWNVENANLDKQLIQAKIKGLNKRAYKEQLDRQVQIKKREYQLQNVQKRKQLEEVKNLAQAEKMAKIFSKQHKQQIEKHYGQQNEDLIKIQKSLKTTSKQIERKNINNFLEHPFVKLVDSQDNRMQNLRKKFIKQNEINKIQEEIKNQQKQATRYRQMQQKNEFIDYVELTHQKRSEQRQRFKHRYLKIKKAQINPEQQKNIKQEDSIEKMYVNYLNNQMKTNYQKKLKQKAEIIDDGRISKFYSRNHIQPDSSPAFLGRNPLSYERRRQLYFINKHLNTQHQRSNTSNDQLNNKTDFISNIIGKDRSSSNQYLKLSNKLNPDEKEFISNKKGQYPINLRNQRNQSESLQIKPYLGERHIVTQMNISQRENNNYKNQQHLESFDIYQKHNSEGNRRIKSQLAQHINLPSNKLPNISKRLFQANGNENKDNKKALKQYFRYDVITGKQVAFYV